MEELIKFKSSTPSHGGSKQNLDSRIKNARFEIEQGEIIAKNYQVMSSPKISQNSFGGSNPFKTMKPADQDLCPSLTTPLIHRIDQINSRITEADKIF
mgnify:CR=1 FL=1